MYMKLYLCHSKDNDGDIAMKDSPAYDNVVKAQ